MKVRIPLTYEDTKHQPDFRICPNCGVIFDANLEESDMHKLAMASG